MGAIFLWRKILAGLFTGIVVTLIFVAEGLFNGDVSVLMVGLIVLFFVLLTIGLYGVPVSILAEVILPEKVKYRWLYALLIHVGFVIVPLLIFKMIEPRTHILYILLLVSTIAAVFWGMDELLKRWMPFLNRVPDRKTKMISGIVSSILILSSLGWFGFSDQIGFVSGNPPLTKYYVPEDHKGWLYVFYDRPGKPALEKEGDFRVIQFNEKGVAWTSTEFEGASLLDNEYFFVSESGEKKTIPKERIHFGPISGFSSTELGDYETIERIQSKSGS
ncbi:DUF6843 domain-containing protein [Pseudalkalibacillus sp. Hm43]|uniref:DUF6843 domain-containing protein n=1 Tax=Pseudalkalibacillus sp. Hm43 TaxID=3450742 RepID=UPI003F427007